MVRTKTRRRPWSESSARTYFAKRKWIRVLKSQDRGADLSIHTVRKTQRSLRRRNRRQDFDVANYRQDFKEYNENWPEQLISDLDFWCRNGSWTYCSNCHMFSPNKLLNTFRNRILNTTVSGCTCLKNIYVVPRYSSIPLPLRNLTFADVCILRSLDLHQGEYVNLPHGYRKKNAMSRCSWSRLSVLEKINGIHDTEASARCFAAYQYLMQAQDSHYAHFVTQREASIKTGRQFNMYDFRQNRGIECCLWPSLYPFSTWCESMLSGDGTKSSTSRSWIIKVKSEILDYQLTYDLIQFQYDLWLFRTVSGAISVGIARKCSPARTLDCKIFSSEYWKWHHLQLIDAVRQYGLPNLFVTISPYEWTFPTCTALTQANDLNGLSPTDPAPFMSLHIAHVLEQYVRGFLTGQNTNKWKTHLLRNKRDPATPVVRNYFYRLEFQNRGTCHVHILIWLDLKDTIVEDIRGDIPWGNPQAAFLVTDLQHSDSNALPLRDDPTRVEKDGTLDVLRICHPIDAFSRNLRGYFATILGSLQCRMDIQTTDQRSMILRYVTSYVSKSRDSQLTNLSFSSHVAPYMAAYRYLSCICPTTPEMTLQLSSTKLAWNSCDTKRLVPPRVEHFQEHEIVKQYVKRGQDVEAYSLIEWSRHFIYGKNKSHKKKALVAVRYNSIYHEEFFFQDLACNLPFRSLTDLLHPHHDIIPKPIRYFAASICKLPERWSSNANIRTRLSLECNKDIYIDNVIHYIESLRSRMRSWELRLTRPSPAAALDRLPPPLQGEQIVALERIKVALRARTAFYESVDCLSQKSSTPQWAKLIFLKGRPGTGKSHLIRHAAFWATDEHLRVIIAVPTGMLVAYYNESVPNDVTVDTVHSIFHVPVDSDIPMQIEDYLSQYDLLILDEVSMVSERIARHFLATIANLHVRPVIVLAGDPSQQQPIDEIEGRVTQVDNIYSFRELLRSSVTVTLYSQHRHDDSLFTSLVDHMRTEMPTLSLLRTLAGNRILCQDGQVSNRALLDFCTNHPNSMFVTISRQRAFQINMYLTNEVNKGKNSLGSCLLDFERPTEHPIFVGMPIAVTRNINKHNGIVNGKMGHITALRQNNIEIQVKGGTTLLIHPVTIITPENNKITLFPFVPAYASTICKVQGQTFDKIAVFFDVDTVPNGSGYMAVTRVKRLQDLYFVTQPKPIHFTPVHIEN